MQKQGITFDQMPIAQAQHLLDTSIYYFKLAAYRTNFAKDQHGNFLNLDFAYLAAIDNQLRAYLLDLALDVEHMIKTVLLTSITTDPKEDGYAIVQDFKKDYRLRFTSTLGQLKKNRYLSDLYENYSHDMPIWVFIEVTSFGGLSQFVDFYYEKRPTKKLRQIQAHLKFCKNIRNACAHSNPFLANLFSEKEFLPHPTGAVMSAATTIGIPKDYVHDLKINDLVSTFYLHKKLQSENLSKLRVQQGEQLLERCQLHADWYASSQKLAAFYAVLSQLIDYLK